ncbi:fumarylacetoacetate hydrolase family protein [Paraburkholderia lycopersici]|uniref:5-oxopent-3-ene-1,2,5-tricarboxylate decarboxylase / 2-hydroxyhepta-2,4-diene-1,7-dioate isomerase n=1 Tax=Paraburkholderia lycopersici TaxID=416944 RepID=A0A1G7BB53_9BURK|nr:fumarylacetoacetate hydrolase family protein [Paraburkholderia lycopersici]SDE24253.1 5-oxopent-3-ene-1,2,5-tricarboxylate decarboxylase / 2-hydroxyhepta-2,4-diene-1,7-dioate isomerase [Paraburkholderia lycopersici]
MFSVADHLLHIEGDALPLDVDAASVRTLLAGGAACRAPVSGAVYGTLLNDRHALEAMGDAVNAPPYKAPPRAPILYLKPRNTLAGHRARVAVPGSEGVQVGASLGIVIGRAATRVAAREAFDYIAGYTLVADLCVSHASVYRPSVRFRARDNFCVVGPAVISRRHVPDPDRLPIAVNVRGRAMFSATTATNVRGVARLLADVTEFMTLSPGDVITLGVPHGAPVVDADAHATIAIGDWAPLEIEFVAGRAAQGARA